MEPKKNVFTKLRDRTKLFNVKIGKKAKKTPLKYRRSISVPDLRCGQSVPPMLNNVVESPDSDSASFIDQDETESETSSLAYSDNLAVTDGPFSARSKDLFLDISSSTKSVDQHSASDTASLHQSLDQPTSPDSATDQPTVSSTASAAKHLDQLTASSPPYAAKLPNQLIASCPPYAAKLPNQLIASSPPYAAKLPDQLTASSTPSATKVVDQFTFPDIPASNMHSASDVLSAPQKPAVMAITNNRPDKRTEEGGRRTRWYLEDPDNESACSTPSEDRSVIWGQELTTDFITPGSTEMCITGSAEDLDDVISESSDFDTIVSGGENKSQNVQYLLTINLKEGRNLVIRDRSGTSDPYVKFKLDGKTVYKSKVMYRNLNPLWNESFSFTVRDLEQTIFVKVYDRDLRSHDFMGSSAVVLNKLELDKTCEMILRLEDAGSPEDDMGVIILDACVTVCEGPTKRNKWPMKRKGSFNKGQPQQVRAATTQKSQVWSELYTVVLVEGQDMPEGGQGDVYVLFSLGDQRFHSKNLCIKANPQWRETFDFNRFDDGLPDMLVVEVFCKRGRKREECWGTLEFDLSQLPVNQKQSYTHVVGAGKGRLVFLVTRTPCPGASVSDMGSAPLDHLSTCEGILKQYNLRNTLMNLQDVGYLQVKVLRATDLTSTDLNGKSDPFCVLELGNCRLQSQTIYKTLSPEWKTAFTFPIKDIHDVLELTVFGEDGDKSRDFLGKVAIPLLTVSNGQQITRLLKKEDLAGPSKGSITLEMSIFYNPVRAAIRTFKPKEKKFVEDSPKFNKKLLARNIYRVRRISMAVLYTLQYIKSCFQWESTQRSITAFLIFVGTVWHFELFMLPLFFLLLIGWNYFHIPPGAGSHSQDLESMSVAEDEDEDEKESEKRGLMEKIHMIQEIVLTVQNVLDEVACIGERVKNTFNWSVPFLSFLACVVLFTATAALYYIPLRYIVLLWGVKKFAKKLLNPHAIDNNELLDFLKRVPSDVQKVQYGELRAAGIQSAQKKKR
ncbi:multiple C2 and transmembrane domain-containing protein 2 [Colossoma macropomum]|uniref:multiple C2 and transmembrane domain-containing protein 2 n=1 Tax=Colossoma macropomum TaxID=42526 RepID=UPI00186445A2|nr:multiple C2 and transmembrane domain-containing protein 2 [Colossoma macropomum]